MAKSQNCEKQVKTRTERWNFSAAKGNKSQRKSVWLSEHFSLMLLLSNDFFCSDSSKAQIEFFPVTHAWLMHTLCYDMLHGLRLWTCITNTWLMVWSMSQRSIYRRVNWELFVSLHSLILYFHFLELSEKSCMIYKQEANYSPSFFDQQRL